ncbi:MAG: 30S ribosomal protein S6, partial [Gallionellales bacterium RIFOXYD2_FULL_52_7]
ISGVRKFLEEKSSQILQEKNWGKKRFAYPIKKFDEGHYVLLRFNTQDSNTPRELERFYRLNEQILRFLILKAE